MKRTKVGMKLMFVIAFVAGAVMLLIGGDEIVRPAGAFSDGPPLGRTGAPGEQTCTQCHSGPATGGQFSITPPHKYIPGQTYQVAVQHVNSDTTRLRWGYQLTALAGTTMAGTFATTDGFSQVATGANRDYVQQTVVGSFAGTTGGAGWTFNWTAPSANVGVVSFYAAGNQANNDNGTSGDDIVTTTATSRPLDAPFDFDGDRKTDVGILRPGPGEWWIRRSSTSQTFAVQFGSSNDSIAPGDFTGDGKADIAIWRPASGTWFILRSEDFSFYSFPFGTTGDVAVPGDYDGDLKTDAAVYRPSSNFWYVSKSSGGTDIVQFGAAGDQPVPSDYDGDGKADIAIFRPSLGQWWMNRSAAGILAVTFGNSSDRTVPGDYTGDAKSDVALWRPSTGEWFVLRSEDMSFYSVPFGTSGDIPSAGDYDGDGKWDTAVFRPTDTNWYINRSTSGNQVIQFGVSGDRPIPNAFVR